MGLKETALALGVAILAALFVGFALDALYEGPERDDFCEEEFLRKPFEPERIDSCEPLNEILLDCEEGYTDYKRDAQGCATEAFCNTCQVEYNAAQESYNFKLLWITAPLGLILIVIGLFLTLQTIGSGLLFAGILTLAQITIRVFDNLGQWSRVLILGVELALLIWIGYKKVETKNKKK